MSTPEDDLPDLATLQSQALPILNRLEAERERDAIRDVEAAAEAELPPNDPTPPLEAYEHEPMHVHGRAAPSRQASPARLAGRDFADMQPHLNDGYVLKGIIGSHSLVAIIGPTSCGKTFFAADLAMHIAAGKEWRGYRVRRGLVVYAALEGPVSAENRFVAARHARMFETNIPLRLTPGPLNLRSLADQTLLIDFILEAQQKHGKCVTVFIDTLSRAMAGGDENGPEDMGLLVQGADHVRQATGAAVILVHHLGKDETRGARGHSSLKAALDTEIEVTVSGDVRCATVTKQRDFPSGAKLAFRLKSVELGRDEDGDSVTTCIVEHTDELPAPTSAGNSLKGPNQKKLLAALKEWSREHPKNEGYIPSTELRAIAKSQNLERNRVQEVVESLIKFGWLQDAAGGFRVLK